MNFRADPVSCSPSLTGRDLRWLDRLRLRASAARPGEPEPWWIEYPKSFFPVILIVFLLRSFLVEPFKIPSSSMRPTLRGRRLHPGQQVHLRHPPADHREEDHRHQRSRSAATSWCSAIPINPSQDFIKRVVGLPGDKVVYRDKKITVNGAAVAAEAGRHLQLSRGPDATRRRSGSRSESDDREHSIADQPGGAAGLSAQRARLSRTGELRLQ